jgi:glycosyltransferase involved in cell wall biosynthesis
MISVCIATYNGEKYLKEQLNSILIQLSEEDEVLISDDGSSDNTLAILESFNDSRIKVYINNFKNVVNNFEFVINKSIGDYIFLSDQDDIWAKSKIKEYMSVFSKDDKITLVISNLQLIDKDGNFIHREFYKNKFTNKLLNNLIKNNFIGCSMAFRKEVKNVVLPFPISLAMHDWWIGSCSIIFGKVEFIDKKLMYYRRHENNVTKEGGAKLLIKLIWRVKLIIHLIFRIIKLKK